ncbi:hypothetical protein POVWA2_063180 [Plasmodium ovale wallikeri]|uniref:Uncharacterized protein n=1 Tax=Plasmodium ovale wallikeri TaxID=864142 RepID=A0A1A9A851_PLAOA|nr:hypothetical protein POVWA2_063180 [Plasmodium ovale wallikeri]
MQRGQYNCDKIKAASKKQTNDIFIRYKTPILDGAIKIINQFKKDKNDGVHYKKLCEELLKYVKAQKKCVREEVSNEGKSLTAREWNKIVNALYTTFNSQKIKRLCYLENDKEETTKKYILNIHEVFRNFCIEKKAITGFATVGTRIPNFLVKKIIIGIKFVYQQTEGMSEYASEDEHANFYIRKINVAHHSA